MRSTEFREQYMNYDSKISKKYLQSKVPDNFIRSVNFNGNNRKTFTFKRVRIFFFFRVDIFLLLFWQLFNEHLYNFV